MTGRPTARLGSPKQREAGSPASDRAARRLQPPRASERGGSAALHQDEAKIDQQQLAGKVGVGRRRAGVIDHPGRPLIIQL
jgi:hypothetical protein